MKDLKGFIAVNEKGVLGVIQGKNEMFREYFGRSIEVATAGDIWTSKKPHVIDSVPGLKAKARVSEKAFLTKTGKEL